jgi:N-acetylmuramoyl-L-alanine amidase
MGVAAVFLAGCAAQAPYIKLEPSLRKDIRVLNGVEYLPIIKLCDTYGFSCKWDDIVKTATIEGKNGRAVLMAGAGSALVGNSQKKLDRPALLYNDALFVPVSFVRKDLGYLFEKPYYEKPPEVAAAKKFAINTIMLDSGHGGKDVGALGRSLRLREKDLALAISKRLKGVLEENGIRVVMTRSDDTFIPLSKRAEIANRSGADLFISIHVNASRSRRLSGFECYYLSNATDDNARAVEAFENSSLKIDNDKIFGNSDSLSTTLWDMTLTENRRESVELARSICNSIGDSGLVENKGTKTARFYVLKHVRIPSVLVEVAYISNRYEEMKLKDPRFLDKVTDALAQGILHYKREYESTEGFTNI